MTSKEWLSRGRKLNNEVNELLEARDEAFAVACGAAVSYGERVQCTKRNSTENKFINYANYTSMIDKKIDELYGYKEEIMQAINRIDNSTYRALLIAYYVNCKNWEQVAKSINYDIRWTYRLHGRALQAIEIHCPCMI